MSIAELERRGRAPEDGPAAPLAASPGARQRRLGRATDAPAARVRAAATFAGARPGDGSAMVRQRRLVELDARASATAWIISRGLEADGAAARLPIVAAWGTHAIDGTRPLVVDEGCDVVLDHFELGPASRRALLEWLPPTCTELALYECGLFGHDPAGALGLLLRPPTIWSPAAAVAAERRFARGPRFDEHRFTELERSAHSEVRRHHLTRLREAAARIERRLPCERLPRASRTVAAGCAAVVTDDDRCAALAALQLARYASSARVGVETRGMLVT